MNILFFTYDFPYPTNSGGKTRAFNLIKHAKKDAHIILFSFTRPDFQEGSKEKLQDVGVKSIYTFPRRRVSDIRNLSSLFSSGSVFRSLYYDRRVAEKLAEVVIREEIHLIHFESFYTGFYLDQFFTSRGVRQVFGTENIESDLYRLFATYHSSAVAKFFYNSQAKKISREEREFYRKSDAVLAVSLGEEELIKSETDTPCYIIENGVDKGHSSAAHLQETKHLKTALFIGNFSYFPNVDAMKYFMQHVLPVLPSDVLITVVGRGSTSLSFLNSPRVKTVEYVEDPSDLFRLGNILISPVRIGGGTNFKILEAMSVGLPVVALADRADVLGFTDGKEMLIAKSPREFAEKMTTLLTDMKLQRRLITNAQKEVQKKYSWNQIGEKLYNVWAKTINEKA